MKRDRLDALLHPDAVVVTYRLPGAEPVRAVIDGSKHDQFEICDRAQRRMFPEITDEDRCRHRAEADAVLKKYGTNSSEAKRGQGEGARANPRSGPSELGAPGNLDPRETYRIRDTSMRAILQLRADGKITERQKELLEFYAEQVPGANFTRQEIARYMMNRHGAKWAINQVCGRVKELLNLGRLRELPEYRKCSVTQESVNAIERGVW